MTLYRYTALGTTPVSILSSLIVSFITRKYGPGMESLYPTIGDWQQSLSLAPYFVSSRPAPFTSHFRMACG
jgi:hypothetical protein